MKNEKQVIRKINKLFPSCKELMTKEEYMMDKIVHPITLMAFRDSNQWEGVAQAVGNMLMSMTGRGLVEYYGFEKNGNGSASVYDFSGNTYEIEGLDKFEAMLKIMFMSILGKPFSDKQHEAYLDFMEVDRKIARIFN